jgi:flagellar biosynthesis chaperone FliJ
MKKITLIFFVIFLVSCKSSSSEEQNSLDNMKIDSTLNSILLNNNKNFELTNQMNKQSDSVVSNKVENTVKKITNLETQVTQLKKENNELKEKLDDAINDNGKPFKLVPVSPN